MPVIPFGSVSMRKIKSNSNCNPSALRGLLGGDGDTVYEAARRAALPSRFATEAVAFDVAVDVFRIETLPNGAAVSRELWGNMFERSEFVSPPDWQPAHLGT